MSATMSAPMLAAKAAWARTLQRGNGTRGSGGSRVPQNTTSTVPTMQPGASPATRAPRTSTYSWTQRSLLAYLPKISAFLSILGSSYILYDLVLQKRKILSFSFYQRVLVLMSTIDILSSIWLFLGTWAVPPMTTTVNGEQKSTLPGSAGSQTTCEIQGVFIQLGMIVPLLNAGYAFYTYLVVCHGWRETQLKRNHVGRIILGIPFVFGLATAIAGIPLELYNFSSSHYACWISPKPRNCNPLFTDNDSSQPCERGENGNIYRLAFGFAPVWLCFFVMIGLLWLVYIKIRSLEQRSRDWTFSRQRELFQNRAASSTFYHRGRGSDASSSDLNSSNEQGPSTNPQNVVNISKSRLVATQSLFLTSAFLITWTIPTIYNTLATFGNNGGWRQNYGLWLTSALSLPLQGFWNFLAYLRPRYVKHRLQYPDLSYGRILWMVIFESTALTGLSPRSSKNANQNPNKSNEEGSEQERAVSPECSGLRSVEEKTNQAGEAIEDSATFEV